MKKEHLQQTEELLTVSPSPHLRKTLSTSAMMFITSICLLPAWGWGVWLWGWEAAVWPVFWSVLACLIAEGLINLFTRRFSLNDGSALLSGLLIGLTLPPQTPFYIPLIGGSFAMLVVKHSFGGLGCNWLNPALSARVFVFLSFPEKMIDSWTSSQRFIEDDSFIDALSTATPLIHAKESFGTSLTNAPMEVLDSISYSDLFLGRIAGSIGETNALFLLIGGCILLALRIITWHIPLAYLGSVALSSWLLAGLPYQQGFFAGDPLFSLLSGGVMLATFFMATDPASSPLHRRAMLYYGTLAGFLTVFLRIYSNYPEGVMFAILIANFFSPLLDHTVKDPLYGQTKTS